MSLNDFGFILFFSSLFFILIILQYVERFLENSIKKYQLLVLLIFSYIFIAISSIKFLISIIMVTLFSYIIGYVIYEYKRHSKKLLSLGIIFMIMYLGYFKYMNFFLDSFSTAFGIQNIGTLNIILPMGISFYVFSIISYLIDVYREKYKPEKNFLHYSLYISFFPKIISGPIVRADDFLPQVHQYAGIKWVNFNQGITLFLIGLFKKIVLADHLGVFVDDIFHSPSAFSTGTLWLAVISYSFQIYLDFSGYSDMAVGISKILGFDILNNFNLPYLATNVSDFWSRWHISLSSWFRDYLYFPLGGSRVSKKRAYFNTFIVMVVSGLWHGAGWTFIIWGALFGLWNVLYNALRSSLSKYYDNKLYNYFSIVFTFLLVTLLWVFFRADSFDKAILVFRGLFSIQEGIVQPFTWSFVAFGLLIGAYIFIIMKTKSNFGSIKLFNNQNGNLQVDRIIPKLHLENISSQILLFVFIGIIIIFGYFGDTAFIYGAF